MFSILVEVIVAARGANKLSRIVPRGVRVDRIDWYTEYLGSAQGAEMIRDVDGSSRTDS
jgi:hypothetical protein